jgi:hypothetical protein
MFFKNILLVYFIQHGFICRPSDSTVSKNAGIKPRTLGSKDDRIVMVIYLKNNKSNKKLRAMPTSSCTVLLLCSKLANPVVKKRGPYPTFYSRGWGGGHSAWEWESKGGAVSIE